MSKYLVALALLCSTSLFAQKELEVFYFQVDSVYLESTINEALRYLHKNRYHVKSIQYNDIDIFISSFMIVYEKR